MPDSCRRQLRLLSNFVLRDGGILLQRETGISGLGSLGGGRGLHGAAAPATNSNNNNYIDNTRTATTGSRSVSFLASSARGRHQRRSETSKGFMVSKTSTTTTTSLIAKNESFAVVKTAGFHSSPLSWFAADVSSDEEKLGDATTTTTTTTDGDENESNEEPSATDIDYNFSPPTPLSRASQDKIREIFDKVLWLDMIEVHLLTQIVNERMGMSWKETEMRQKGGGGGVSKAGSGGGSVEEEVVEEKTIFDLKLVGFDAKAKIKVIKEVRTIAGLGLKEAKDMVEGAPKVIQKELKKEQAEELKAKLEAVGAQVELV